MELLLKTKTLFLLWHCVIPEISLNPLGLAGCEWTTAQLHQLAVFD